MSLPNMSSKEISRKRAQSEDDDYINKELRDIIDVIDIEKNYTSGLGYMI